MTKRPARSSRSVSAIPTDYVPLLAEIKARVQAARVKAALAANQELVVLYWDIGRLILARQKKEGWGARIIDRLSADLQREFPGQQGFSPRNLKYMRAFAEAWPDGLIVQQPAAQLSSGTPAAVVSIVQAPLAQMGGASVETAGQTPPSSPGRSAARRDSTLAGCLRVRASRREQADRRVRLCDEARRDAAQGTERRRPHRRRTGEGPHSERLTSGRVPSPL